MVFDGIDILEISFIAEQKITPDFFHMLSARVSSSPLVPSCLLFKSYSQAKGLTSAAQTLTHWLFPPERTKSWQPSLSYSASLTHSVSVWSFVCLQLRSLPSPLVFPTPHPFVRSSFQWPTVSILAGVIDFSKG